MPTPRLRLGQLLVDAKMISQEALDEVLALPRPDGQRLGMLLVERKLINETQLTQILSHQLSVPWVSLLHIEFSRQLLNLVPHYVADRFCLVPIYVRHVRGQGETLYVAMDDPTNDDGLKACREHSGLPVRAMIAPPSDIRSAIRVYYGMGPRQPDAAPAAAPVAAPAEAPAPPPERAAAGARTDPAPPPERMAAGARTDPAPAPVSKPAPAPVSKPPPAPVSRPAPAPELAPKSPATPITQPAPAPTTAAVVARAEASRPAVEVLPAPDLDMPEIEAVEVPIERVRSERLRSLLEAPPAQHDQPPPSEREVEAIPRPRGRAPRMVSLTLLDGTTITLPAKRAPAERKEPVEEPAPAPRPVKSEPPSSEEGAGLTARDLVVALRAVSHGADASEVLGSNVRWEAMFAALLSLMLKKHLIADWEFVDELKKL